MQGAAQSMGDHISKEYHFVMCANDPPANVAPLALSYYLEGLYQVQALVSLEEAKEKRGFNFGHIIPDPAGTSKSKSFNDEQLAEELLGEATENLTKLNTTLTVNANLNCPSDLLPVCKNIILFMRTICHVDEQIQPPPDIYSCALQLAELATSPEVRDWLKQDRSAAHFFSFWGFSVLEQMFIQTTRIMKVPSLLCL